MKRILALTVLLCLTSFCYGQAFDKDMLEARKEFNKNSKKLNKAESKKAKKNSQPLDDSKKKKKKISRRKKSSEIR